MKRILIRGALMVVAAQMMVFSHSRVVSADVNGRTDNGQDITIPDADVNGVPSSTNTITIMENEIIEDVTFTIEGLNHFFVGDLFATVSHFDTDGNLVGETPLFVRVGRDTFGVGDSSDIVGDFAFNDASNNDLWQAAADDTTDMQPIPSDTYFASGANSRSRVDLLATFEGQSTAGTWVLNLSDRNDSVEGTFREFAVNFVSSPAVPEPSTVALWVIGLGIASTRRRRK